MAELQNEDRPFVIRFEVLTSGKVTGTVAFLKLPGKPPINVTDFDTSVVEHFCTLRGISNTCPLPNQSASSSSSSPLPPPPLPPPPALYPCPEPPPPRVYEPASPRDHEFIVDYLGEEWDSLLLSVGGDQFRFFGCVWTGKENLLRAHLYPECLQVDTTANTNLFNHPMVFLVGANGNNKSENWLTGLLPNQQEDTFMWLLGKMLPLFLSPVLKGLHVVISDGDKQLIAAIEYCINEGIFPAGTVRLLCFWHTISLVINKKFGFLGAAVCKSAKNLLTRIAECSAIKRVRSLWATLEAYLEKATESKVEAAFVTDVLNVMKSKQANWCRAWFPNARTYGEKTPGRSEVENRQHKKSTKVYSKASMAATVSADFLRAKRRTTQQSVDIISSLRHSIPHAQDSGSMPLWVKDELTPYAAKLFAIQWEKSFRYKISQPTPLTYTLSSSF